MAQKSGGRNKCRKQMVSAGLDDARADELAVGDAKKEVQDNSTEEDDSVVYELEENCPAELDLEDSIRSSYFPDKITSEEVASYSTTSCENSQGKFDSHGRRYHRIFCEGDNKASLSTIAAEYLIDRNDLRLKLYKGFTNEKFERHSNEGTEMFYEFLKKENLIGQSDFVCRSGLLTTLCKTPFTMSDRKSDHGMILAVQKIGSTYYMQKFETEDLRRWEESKGEQALRSEYGGKTFEVLVSANSEMSTTYNFDEEYVSVRKIQFGGHSLIIRGGIDGCLPIDQSYVEIKTTTDGYDDIDIHSVKTLGWWFQCSFVRAEKILCGFRNNESGIVKRIKWYKVDDLTNVSTVESHIVGLQCLEDVLDFTMHHVKKDKQPYYLERKRGSRTFTLHQDETSKYDFLPKWLYQYK